MQVFSAGVINPGGGSGSVTSVTGTAPISSSGGTTPAISLDDLGVSTTKIANDAVTYAKIQNVTDNRLLGRSAGSSGDTQEITVGSGLSLSGGALTATVTSAINDEDLFAMMGA